MSFCMRAYFHDIGKTVSLREIQKYDNFKIIFDTKKNSSKQIHRLLGFK